MIMEYIQINTRVLVIDDEEMVRDNIEEILVPRVKSNDLVDSAANILFDEEESPIEHRSSNIPKFIVDKASNGAEGLEMVRKSIEKGIPYAVIFLDMRMPGWDGLETATKIREIEGKAEIIFVTAYSDTSIEDIVSKAGQNVGYHCKPYASEEIIQLATKATDDYNKLRNLEQLIDAISNINISENHLNPLLKNILDQLAAYSQTDTALLGKMHKDGYYEKIFSIGAMEEKVNPALLQKVIDQIFLNSDENLVQSNEIIFAKLEDYVVFAALKKGTRLKTEKLYLLRLFVQNAAKAIRNAELQVKLLEKEKLSAAGKAISMLMHDLRSPIKNIPVITGFMREDGIESEWLPALDKSAEEASEMLDDFMDFIREAPVTKQEINLNELITEAIESSRHTLDFNELKINVHINTHIPIKCDRSKFKRVLTNLINNASEVLIQKKIKYPTIEIMASIVDSFVEIEISDNGPGIPDNILKSLFDPFVTHGKAGGTGLGLAIVKQFVIAHGGTISVQNNVGAVFSIKIPV